MLARLDVLQERREQERRAQARIPPASACPSSEPRAIFTRDWLDRSADRRPTFSMRVEQQARPVRRGNSSGTEVRDRNSLVCDDGLLLGRQSRRGLVIVPADDNRSETPRRNSRPDLHLQVQRRSANFGEPEAVLLDQVEREDVAARRARRSYRNFDLDCFTRRDRPAEGSPQPVPDNRVPERIEPVVRESHAGLSTSPPRCRTGVLECEPSPTRGPSPRRLHLVREPAHGERAGFDGMLTDAFHRAEFTTGYPLPVSEPLLVRALRREPVERTPVWFMRQAGRSLPEYRALRERHSFFDLAGTPELCAEVTLQPVRRHDVDAAVLFADIMTPVLGMGIDVQLLEGVGPVIERPIRTLADVERLRVPDPDEAFAPVLEAVRLVRDELSPEKALVGFCGGPFTVAGYLVEGRPSRELPLTKRLMLAEPEVWTALLEKLTATFAAYIAAKARAGADAIQLFDSWVGVLSAEQYRRHVAPFSARILAASPVPTIHFGTGANHLLEELAAAGGDGIGLDWRVPLDVGWAHVPDRAVQGNLDPATLLCPWAVVEREAADVLRLAGGQPGHIFNLGHGVLPPTDPDTLSRLVGFVRETSTAKVAA